MESVGLRTVQINSFQMRVPADATIKRSADGGSVRVTGPVLELDDGSKFLSYFWQCTTRAKTDQVPLAEWLQRRITAPSDREIAFSPCRIAGRDGVRMTLRRPGILEETYFVEGDGTVLSVGGFAPDLSGPFQTLSAVVAAYALFTIRWEPQDSAE